MGNPAELQLGKDPRLVELTKTIRKAENGDEQALAEVRELAQGKLARLWETYGNPAANVEAALIHLAAGDNALQQEAMRAKAESLRRELEGPAPTPLERLLAQRIVLCWLQVNYEDASDVAGVKRGTSWTQCLNQQQRAERAQRRLTSAIKALAQVRRLALPVLQLNVAEKQVNIGSAQVGKGSRNE